MGACVMGGPEGPKIESVEQMFGRFVGEILEQVPVWRQRLMDCPDNLGALGRQVHAKFVLGADMVIAGMLAVVLSSSELVAMHLHRLGAAEASSITFVAAGAPWIWDRIDRIVSQAKITPKVKIHQVLDNCHAAHQISLALAALGFDDRERVPYYRAYRTQLRNGQWRQVVEDLSLVAADNPEHAPVQTEIEYLRKHRGRRTFSSLTSRNVRSDFVR